MQIYAAHVGASRADRYIRAFGRRCVRVPSFHLSTLPTILALLDLIHTVPALGALPWTRIASMACYDHLAALQPSSSPCVLFLPPPLDRHASSWSLFQLPHSAVMHQMCTRRAYAEISPRSMIPCWPYVAKPHPVRSCLLGPPLVPTTPAHSGDVFASRRLTWDSMCSIRLCLPA